jgi:acetyl/propionyl-CoA carboxylase alpha subunit
MEYEEKDFEIFPLEGANYRTRLTDKFRSHKPYEPEDPNRIIAQIPGTILKVMVKEGQQINPSKCLFILEAMKMKNKVFASVSGQIKKIHITEGQVVTKNQLLVELGEPDSIFKKLREKSAAREQSRKNADKSKKEPRRTAKKRDKQ